MKTPASAGCRHCGVMFTPYNARNIYCSRRCMKNANKPKYTKSCAVCSSVFKTTFSKKSWCSKECGKEYPKIRIRVPRFESDCIQCGSKMTGIKSKRFCSDRCQKTHLKKKSPECACMQCGQPYPNYRRGDFCSRGCSSQWRHAQIKETSKCKVCGDDFNVSAMNVKMYCSTECRNVAMTVFAYMRTTASLKSHSVPSMLFDIKAKQLSLHRELKKQQKTN